jgi:hypothetical protein
LPVQFAVQSPVHAKVQLPVPWQSPMPPVPMCVVQPLVPGQIT